MPMSREKPVTGPSVREVLQNLYDLRCKHPAVSGRESGFVNALLSWLEPAGFAFARDTAGNLFVSTKTPLSFDIVLDAHVDEVGCVITGNDAQGRFRFEGMLPANELVDAPVIVCGSDGTKYRGVCRCPDIGTIKESDVRKLLIDVEPGSNCLLRVPRVGDAFTWDQALDEGEGGSLVGRGLDNLAGVAACVHVLFEAKLAGQTGFTVAFTVQEEIGFRGMAALLATKAPRRLVVVDAFSAVHDRQANMIAGPKLGEGPVVALGPGQDANLLDVAEQAFGEAGVQLVRHATFYPEPTNAAVVMPTCPATRAISVGFPLEGKHGRRERIRLADLESLCSGLKVLIARLKDATNG
jgi:endoglucanase